MSLLLFINLGPGGNVVQLPESTLVRLGSDATIYSGLKFDTDGNLYARQTAGGWSSIGPWLLNGTAGDFTVVRTIDTGTLTTDAGASVVMSAARTYDVQVTTGSKESTVQFDIELTASPGVSLANRTYLFSANNL